MTATPEQPWVDGLLIGQVLDETAGRDPDHEAVVFPQLGLRLSFGQLQNQVNDVARGLIALGIECGQHVGIWATNVPEWILLQLATARIGAVLVTINPAYRPFELEYVLKQSDAVALFLSDRFKTSDYVAMLQQVCPELATTAPGTLQCEKFPRLRWAVSLKGEPPSGAIGWNELIERGKAVDDHLVNHSAISPTARMA